MSCIEAWKFLNFVLFLSFLELYDRICGDVVQPTYPPDPSICTMNPGICPNGRCIPDSNGGGFQCICNVGYERVGMQNCAGKTLKEQRNFFLLHFFFFYLKVTKEGKFV